MRTLSRGLLTLALGLTATLPASLHSQTVIATTFGPGDSYQPPYNGWGVTASQSLAQRFVYGGALATLDQMRLALYDTDNPYTINFRTGTDISTATLLESWTLSPGSDGDPEVEIFTFASLLNPTLTSGSTYWIEATNPDPVHGGWAWNDQGVIGYAATSGGEWTPYITESWAAALAYDVTATVSSTPEPASIALMGVGLIGVGAAVRRRRVAQVR